MMKKILWIFFMVLVLPSCKQTLSEEFTGEIFIIPAPAELSTSPGIFRLDENTSIKAGSELLLTAEQLRNYLHPATGYLLPVNSKKAGANVIELEISDELSSLGDEGYTLDVTTKKVQIAAYTKQGIFWGIQTLRQLLPDDILRKALVDDTDWVLPCVNIVDKPRFKWRGLMIDYSRTFWRKDITENILDALSYYKMNKLHMHLTDDQGWRLEIDKYPALTEIGSRFDTIYNEPEEKQGYYSKDDIAEIVRYAAARNVEIIPEIEMPGHALAVLAAFPELSCAGETPKIHPFSTGPYIHEEILCAGKEETYEFLENVLDEVAELFPSQYIHIGGDEAPKAEWKKCPDCQRAIKENGLEDEHELQSWFIKRIENYLNSKGKKLIGWDEITEGGLSKTATMMFWRGWMEDALLTAVNQGNDVIMSPTTHCYFDYTYETISVEKVYSYEPLSDKLENSNPEHILGVQANFWSHIDREVPKMHRQIFPRILALAEVGWTERGKRNWDNFSSRLKQHYKTLELLDLYYMAQ